MYYKQNSILICMTVISVVFLSLLSWTLCRYWFSDGIIAEDFDSVFGSYNINIVDNYLNNETNITYKGVTKTYEELRPNVIKAFNDKKFSMEDDYAFGGHLPRTPTNEIVIDSWVDYENIGTVEVYIKVTTKYKDGRYVADTMNSEDAFFGYLFFGVEMQTHEDGSVVSSPD